MPGPVVRKIKQGSPTVRLFISDGSERSDYMPQERALRLLGAPHSGVNLMSCYYPRQTFWPERRLFGGKIKYYRYAGEDQAHTGQVGFSNDWTDGYYSFDIADPDNEVQKQLADVRRYGQDARLSVMADIDTPMEEMARIAEILKGFGRIQLRLNHEANGCTWFRFARNVGRLQGEAQRRLYHEISQFFIRVHDLFAKIVPKVTFVACYNGPGERAMRGEIGGGTLPHMTDEELGLMYKLPGTIVSLDQYGSLHYGWPGHAIKDPPVIGPCDAGTYQAFALTPASLCDGIYTGFQQVVSAMRGERTRVDLGEMNFDEDIHGPHIQAYLVHEVYSWIRKHPEVIGSVTFYELTDRGGLGLFRQRRYRDLKNLKTTVLLRVYKDIMRWPEFRHPHTALEDVQPGADSVELIWRSSVDAEGLEVRLNGQPAKAVDFGEGYWRRIVTARADGAESYVHTGARIVSLPPGTESVKVFALPADGRDNSPDGFRAKVPLPAVVAG